MSTVLIAAPEDLTALTARPDLGDAIAFADVDVLQALEAITSLHPAAVVIEKQFADTPRGSALINRITADPSLKSCAIRIVVHERGDTGAPPPAVPPGLVPDHAALSPLDYRGTRRAERVNIASGVEIPIEGNSAQLINMSAVGMQVVSATILKPNQRVRISLNSQPDTTRLASAVAWASFELPQGVARYRAGIEFLPPFDQTVVTRFIKKHKAS